jgi:ATP-dependent protease ClpP protease subunit
MTPGQQTLPQMALPTAHVNFVAEIITKTVEALMGVTSDLVNRGHPAIYLSLSSPGGSVSDGIALYNYLRALPVHLTTHNIGSMNSIANIVFLAGETRRACNHTTFMFHGVSLQTQAPQAFERKALKEHLASVESDEKRIGGIVAERTKLTQGTIDTFFLEAKTLNAQEALEGSIIHEIGQVCIPKGSPTLSLVFQR